MQNLVRSKTIGVTGNGGRGTAGAGPGRALLYGSRGLPAPYRRTADLGPHEPCSRTPRVQTWKPKKKEDAQDGEPLWDMG